MESNCILQQPLTGSNVIGSNISSENIESIFSINNFLSSLIIGLKCK